MVDEHVDGCVDCFAGNSFVFVCSLGYECNYLVFLLGEASAQMDSRANFVSPMHFILLKGPLLGQIVFSKI